MRSGEAVRFLMRSDAEAVRRRGLRVTSPREEFALSPVAVCETAAEVGPVDLVIVGLKTTANDQIESLLRPLLHERTAILTLQNGLGADELLGALFGAERVLGGLCFICVNRTGPGEIFCLQPGSVSFGEFGRPAGEREHALAEMFSRAGVKTQVGDNLGELRWKKLVWNVPFNGLSIAAGGITTDRILADPRLEDQVRVLMAEVISAAAKLGFSIPQEMIEQQIQATRKMGAYRPSSLIDYLDGREVESESIWGEPLRRAQKAGASVPRMEALYATIRRLVGERKR